MHRKHGCEGMDNPFRYVKEEIGKVNNETVVMGIGLVVD